MQPPSVRLVCRARNSFSPSTALWQHFVVPNQHLLRHGRYSSSVAAATQDTTTTNTEHHAFPEATAAEKLHIEPEGNQDTTLPIRKVRSIYSNFVRSKRTASIRRNVQEKLSAGVAASQESMAAIGQLLINTTDSYAQGKSYQGVAVKPVVSEIGIKPRFLPWCIPSAERPPDAMDRYARSITRPVGHSDPDNADSVVRSSYSINT
jgi:non-canonical poly(A) RNA polymerase PAPD5/7